MAKLIADPWVQVFTFLSLLSGGLTAWRWAPNAAAPRQALSALPPQTLETPAAVGPSPALPPSLPTLKPPMPPQETVVSGEGISLALKPKTPGRWVVDAAMGSGADSAALAPVLASVKEGDRVLIRPGTYKETVVISKSAVIEGGGARPEDVQLDWDGPLTVAVAGGKVVLRNLTLVNSGSKLTTVLSVAKAEAVLERVHVRSAGQGVRVSAGTLSASRCTLSSRIGLVVEDRSQVSVVDSAISGTDIGALIKGDAIAARISKSRFTESERAVNVEGRSRLELSDSEISSPAGRGGGVFVFAGARAKLNTVRMKLGDAARVGLYVEDGVLEGQGVTIEASGRSGAIVTKEGSLTLERSRITGSAWAAIVADKRARVTLRRTVLSGNIDCGLQINDAAVSLDGVELRHNRCGAAFSGPGTLDANHSRFSDNALGPLASLPGLAGVTVRGEDNEGFSAKASAAPTKIGRNRFNNDIFTSFRIGQ